jgi:hypothetical protein
LLSTATTGAAPARATPAYLSRIVLSLLMLMWLLVLMTMLLLLLRLLLLLPDAVVGCIVAVAYVATVFPVYIAATY